MATSLKTAKFDVVFWNKYSAQHGITKAGTVTVSWDGDSVTANVVPMNGAPGFKFESKQPKWNALPYGTEITVETDGEQIEFTEEQKKVSQPKLGENMAKLQKLITMKAELGDAFSEEKIAEMTAKMQAKDDAVKKAKEEEKAAKLAEAKKVKLAKDMAELEASLSDVG